MISPVRLAFLLAASASPLYAQAAGGKDSFSFEVGLGYTHGETDSAPELESDELSFSGTYHLKPVALADNPWSEAVFLERSTFVEAGFDFTDISRGALSADGTIYGIGGRYAEKGVPFAADLAVATGSVSGDLEADIEVFGARVGYWVAKQAIIGVSYVGRRTSFAGAADVDTESIGAFGKLVHGLGQGRAVNLEARFDSVSTDAGAGPADSLEVGVAADYYFSQKISLGAELAMSSADDEASEGFLWGLRGSFWFSPKFSLNAGYSEFLADDEIVGVDTEEYTIFFLARF